MDLSIHQNLLRSKLIKTHLFLFEIALKNWTVLIMLCVFISSFQSLSKTNCLLVTDTNAFIFYLILENEILVKKKKKKEEEEAEKKKRTTNRNQNVKIHYKVKSWRNGERESSPICFPEEPCDVFKTSSGLSN